MDDETKGDPVQPKKAPLFNKAGWVKKDTGRLLQSYKDRYIQLEKTEVAIYENEDLKNCLERLNLENYEQCHEIKSSLRKKHRLILIQSPKSGNKVRDVRFQAENAEEKEAWIRALSDGINRAKNKIFDEVKIDESCNLEHVTRTRPKGNRNRRPPTRIHMKEGAGMSSEVILHFDFDPENTFMSNGTQPENIGIETSKEAPQPSSSISSTSDTTEKELRTSTDALHTEPVVCPQKKVIKPPMPPTKETKPPTPEVEPVKEDCPTKKVPNVPLPPPKQAKPSTLPVEEATEKAKIEMIPVNCDDSRNKTSPQTTRSSQLKTNGPSEDPQPPIPPSQKTKPSHDTVVSDQVADGTTGDMEEGISNVQCETAKSPVTAENTRDDSEEAGHSIIKPAGDQCTKHPGPRVPPKKKPEKPEKPGTQHSLVKPPEKPDPVSSVPTATDLSDGAGQAEGSVPTNEIPSLFVSLSQDDGLSASMCGLDEGNKIKAEEKSVDSGQDSDEDSDGSRSGDTLAVSTAAMRGSHAGLDAMDSSEEDVHSLCYSGVFHGSQASTSKCVFNTEADPCQSSESESKGKGFTMAKSASFGDLLSDCAVCFEVKQHVGSLGAKDDPCCHDVRKLEAEVFLEMEKTTELLNRASQSGRDADGDGDNIPESLLTKAMEKLKKAECVLRESKKLKSAKSSINRKSW